MHEWGIYPGTGWIEEAPRARKRIINVPLEARAGEHTYARVIDEVVRPVFESFRPELVLVSAGFDGHWRDPITSLGLSTAAFFTISQKLRVLAQEHCGGRIVFVLEGGYDPANVANGAAAVFAALAGSEAAPDVQDACPHADPDHDARIQEIRLWHGFE
jgi:acetoin utilization deacetylase AcuC-like enzyme